MITQNKTLFQTVLVLILTPGILLAKMPENANFLADPNLLYMLLMLGILCILIEFKSPGIFLPGLFGILCLALVFGMQVLPINWSGALLILLALIFLVAEIFITSFGILAIGGLALLISGSYILFSVPGSDFLISRWLIWLLSLGLLAIMLAVGILLIRANVRGQLPMLMLWSVHAQWSNNTYILINLAPYYFMGLFGRPVLICL